MWAERERSVSGRFPAHRLSLFLWYPLSAPLSPLPLTRFSATPLTLRSTHMLFLRKISRATDSISITTRKQTIKVQ